MKRKRNFVDLSVLIIIIGVAFYVVLVLFSDLPKIIESFEKVKFEYYPLIIVLNFVIYSLLAIRYNYLLGAIGIRLPIKDSFLISFSGQSMFSTFGRAGTVLKSYLIKKKYGHSISKTGPIVLVEQFLDLKSSLLILIIGLFWFQIFEVQLILIVGIILTASLYFIMINDSIFQILKKIISRIKFLKKFGDNIDESKEVTRVLLSFRNIIITTGLSFLVKIFQVLVVFLIFESLGLNLEFLKSGLIYFSSMLAGTFVLLPGGIIVTDSSMIGLLLTQGIDFSASSVAVIITRFITLWLTVIIGLISLKITIKKFDTKFNEK